MKTVARVFSYTGRYPWLALGTLFCAVLSTLLVIVFPAITQVVIDTVIRSGQHDKLLPLCFLGLGAFAAQHALNALRIILNNNFEQRVLFDLRSDLYSHIQSLPLSWFDQRATGDLMTRVIDDVNAVERVVIDGIEQGVMAVLQITIVLVVMFYYSPWLAMWAMAPIPLLIVGATIFTLTAPARYRPQRRAASAMNSLLHDNISGIRQIKAYGREIPEHKRFNEASNNLRKASLRIMYGWAAYHPSMELLSSCGLILVVGFGAAAVIDGSLQIGALVAFLTLVKFLYDPIGKIHQLNQIIQSGRAAGERVFEILDTPSETDSASATPPRSLPRPRGEVRFENVSFSYDSAPTLSGINLHAPAGACIALVGPTGAGKSTLVNLIPRFYELENGKITLDGLDIRDIPKPALREQIGYVTQESFLFNGTVRHNLLIADPAADDARIQSVLRAANAWEFVSRLPEGLESIVGERGVKLSVGERQRLSIARALLKNPPILILDEATASVDTETEKLIQEALEHLMQNRTSFVIAHRLSTIRHADTILVLDRGRIIERGSHRELLATQGAYARLWQNLVTGAE